LKIGVELRLSGDPGELFADARALEAAGADSLWPAGEVDRLMMLAALAAVTWRTRLVAVGVVDPEAARALERLSRGRLVVASRDGDDFVLPGAEGERERWKSLPFPESREAWNELRAKHEADGQSGLVLPNDPRLLDLIRNPDVKDDRQDLKLAFG
jgi:alkanesulfonate monooxygenase SsuD/methylene tetrahydromethanopterin reductase-like flavin-dependent oxidoreductase (luciferase family)